MQWPENLHEMQLIAKELADKFKVKTLAVNVDVTSNDTIEKMMTRIRNNFERIDILCNNAGATFGVPNGIHTYDETAWMKTIDVNLNGVFRISKAVVPMMQEKGGSIIRFPRCLTGLMQFPKPG